jgi:hypothetical protein
MKLGRFTGCMLILAALLFFACKKQALLGVNQLPGGDHIPTFTTDTVTILTKTVRQDTFETVALGQYMLGSIDQRAFGKFNAGIFMQFATPLLPDVNPATITADSIVLWLPYINTGYYGDTTHPVNLNVYQMSSIMDVSSTFPNSGLFGFYPTPVGFKTSFLPRPNKFDSLSVTDTSFREPLKIRLSTHLAQAFIDQIGTQTYTSQGSFFQFFKGLYIAPDLSQGYGNTVLYLDPTGGVLNIYYHLDTSVGIINISPYAGVNYAISNFYSHDYTSSQANSYLTSSTISDSLVFLQGANGLKGQIQIPNLKNLGKILINRAELEVTLVGDTLYAPPSSMIVYRDSAGSSVSLKDYTDAVNATTTVPFGGTRVYETEPTTGSFRYSRYRFTLTEYLQDVVNGVAYTTDDDGLFLSVSNAAQNASQIIVGGAKRNDIYKMKLNLTYTKVQ